ncbi:hypothetical protein WBK31_17520 [Nonomuraea sp. N2-4H]|uniref:WXG100-like domain-containing protein n=1 Tax=Nonomuraea sp. N2-4H TaxID=3128898 RepID=UPI00325599F5
MAYSGDHNSNIQTPGGQSVQKQIVQIDSDVRPVWETEALPDWVNYWLIPMLSAGQKWPEASEAGLSELARRYAALSDGAISSAEPAGSAVRTIVTGWAAPATAKFVGRARELYSKESGITGVSHNAHAYAVQASNFAVQTQYSKLTINVAFWVTVIAIAITLLVAFFTAGVSTPLIGPYAAGARAAISRILVKLVGAAGQKVGAARLAQVAALSGPTGRALLLRVLASPIGRELVEEMGEEFFIEFVAQYLQRLKGTREDFDWREIAMVTASGGGGGITGTVVGGPISRVTQVVPGFAGRALTTGATNVIASPVGSFMGNALVYGELQNPFTAESMVGAFMGGVGRTGTISPFNPDVALALAHPTTTLASAYDAAARTDAARAAAWAGGGSPSADPSGTAVAPTGPGGNQPATAGGMRTSEPVTIPAQRTASTAGTMSSAGSSSGSASRPSVGVPDADASQRRRTPEQQVTPAPDRNQEPNQDDAPEATPERQPARTTPDTAPRLAADAQPSASVTSDTRPDARTPHTNATPESEPATAPEPRTASSPQSGSASAQQPAAGQAPGAPAAATLGDPATVSSPTGTPAGTTAGITAGDTTSANTAVTTSEPSAARADGRPQPAAGQQQTTAQSPANEGAAQPVVAAGAPTGPSTGRTGSDAAQPATPPADRSDATQQPGTTAQPVVTGRPGTSGQPDTGGRAAAAQAADQASNQAADADHEADRTAADQGGRTKAASKAGAPTRARAALVEALETTFPGAVIGPDGEVIVPKPDGGFRVLPNDTMKRLRRTLDDVAGNVDSHPELVVEASALLVLAASSDSLSSDVTRVTPPETHTSIPGTVTSQPIAGTAYVTDSGRDTDVTLDEIKQAAQALDPRHFVHGAQEVRGLSWDGDALTVTTGSGVQHFTFTVGEPGQREMARTRVRAGTAEDPHVVTFAPRVATDQLTRVWLHEITDTFQRQAAGQGRRGILRRMLPGRPAREVRDECVTARRNERVLLIEQWENAPTMPEKRQKAIDIDGLDAELRARGAEVPPPPWAVGPDDVRTGFDIPRPSEDVDELRRAAEQLSTVEKALRHLLKAHVAIAQEAAKDAEEAEKKAETAGRDKDSGADIRATTAAEDARAGRDKQARNERIAAVYANAVNASIAARVAYERYARLLAAPPGSLGPSLHPGQPTMADLIRQARREAEKAYARYEQVLGRSRPDPLSLPEAMPTGRLAHLDELTDQVNALLERKKVAKRFTPNELEGLIRADWHKAVAGDGLVLPINFSGRAIELRIKLRLSDLVEVDSPAMRASQVTVGLFYQTGQSYTATEAGSFGVNVDFNTAKAAEYLIPGSWGAALLEVAGISVGGRFGRNWSASGGGSMFEQGGSVADNRTESLLYDAVAEWTIEERSGKNATWSAPIRVSEGSRGDSRTQRFWVWHSYADAGTASQQTIDPQLRNPKPPNQEVISMTGLEEAFDALAEQLGGEFAQVGTPARQNLRKFVVRELQTRFRQTLDSGLSVDLVVPGDTDFKITAHSEIVEEETRMVGGWTRDALEEEVLTETATSTTKAETGDSFEGKVSAGFPKAEIEDLDVTGPLSDYRPDSIGPSANTSRPVSQSSSSTANEVAVHPQVDKRSGPSQAYRKVAKVTFTIERKNKPPRTLEPFQTELLVRQQVLDAFHAGDPVPVELFVTENGRIKIGDDGLAVLKDSKGAEPIPGREMRLPEWLGAGDGRLRGAGPTDVREVHGLDGLVDEVLAELSGTGLVGEEVDGKRVYSKNPLVRAAQRMNESDIKLHLEESPVRSAFDQLAQGGVMVPLQKHGFNRALGLDALYIVVRQDPDDTGTGTGQVTKVRTHLDIASDTAGRGVSRSVAGTLGGSASKTDGPEEGQDGISHKAGPNVGGDRSYSAATNVTSMVNKVGMTEDGKNKPTAVVETRATIEVHQIHGATMAPLIEPRPITAVLMVPGDMLPREGGPRFSGSMGKPSKRLMRLSTLEHFDVGPELSDIDQVRRLLPKALRKRVAPLIQLWPMLSRHHLAGHIFEGPISNDLVLDPQGPKPTRAKVDVRAELGEAEFVDIADPVSGRIMLALRSVGISWNGAKNFLLSLVNSVGDSDDNGASSDTGSASLPSRNRTRMLLTALVAIFGTEFLGIATGRKYRFKVPVDVVTTVSTSKVGLVGDESRTQRGDTLRSHGNGVFVVPEHDALRMFAEGELKLPVAVVADAVDRFINGHMDLHRTVAVPLITRYIQARREAVERGEDIGLGKRHYPSDLLQALKKVADLEPAVAPAAEATRHDPGKGFIHLADALSKAQEVNDRLKEVVLAPQYAAGMSSSVPTSFTVTNRQGDEVNLMDEALSLIEEAVPGANAATPNLARQVRVDLNDTRSEIHLDEMMSRRGFEREYEVQSSTPNAAPQVVTVRAKLRPKGDPSRARMVSQTAEKGNIIQRYRGGELAHTESHSVALSAGVDYNAAEEGGESKAGASTKRSRSFSNTKINNVMRLLRIARFVGVTTVAQDMELVLEVETRPARVRRIPFERRMPGTAARIRKTVHAVGRKGEPPQRTYDVVLERDVPSDMVRPVAEDPGPVRAVTDPRSVELEPGFFPDTLTEDPDRPTLYDAVIRQLTKMVGDAAVRERLGALSAWLSHSGLITGLEQISGRDGAVVPHVAEAKLRNQGVDVSIKTRMSDLTVVAGPFDGEKGEVDRRAEAQNVSVGRSQVTPVGVNGGQSIGALGVSVGTSAGAQASQSVNVHQGARSERSMFESGKLYTVQVRVDYDLTFERVKLRRDGDVRSAREAVHLPGASGGTAMVTMSGEELNELHARMQAGIRIAAPLDGLPTFRFTPEPGREGLIQVLQDARVAARDRGAVARVRVQEPDGLHHYLAAPDGTVRSDDSGRNSHRDAGFAEAFSTLPPHILDAADQQNLDLREVFLNSPVSGTFTDQVSAALAERGALPRPPEPVWKIVQVEESEPPPGASTFQGTLPSSAHEEALPDSPLGASARPEGEPDLTVAEIRSRHVAATDFGGAVADVRWTGEDRLVVRLPGAADQHVRVVAANPGDGFIGRTDFRAGTAEDPHITFVAPRVHPDMVSTVLVHEISHIAQERAAQAAGAPQGTIRESLSPRKEGADHCLVPRLNEHAHLSRRWSATADPQLRETLAAAINAVATDIRKRGHTPPPPPWPTHPPSGPPAAEGVPGVRVSDEDAAAAARLRALIDALHNAQPAEPSLAAALTGSATASGPSLADALHGSATASGPSLADALHGRPAAPHSLADVVNGGASAPGSLAGASNGTAPATGSLADALSGRPAARRSLGAVFGGGRSGAAEAAAAIRAEAERAGLAPGQPGATAKLVALARAGELAPEHVAALRGAPELPELAAANAVSRAAALMGAKARVLGPGLIDVQLPGRPPLAVEIRPPAPAIPAQPTAAANGAAHHNGEASPNGVGQANGTAHGTGMARTLGKAQDTGVGQDIGMGAAGVAGSSGSASAGGAVEPTGGGVVTYQVDGLQPVGANERAAAAVTAGAIAAAMGLPAAPYRHVAALVEAARQVRAATVPQRRARLGVLYDLAATAPMHLVPAPVAAELTKLLDGPRPGGRDDRLERARTYLERGRKLSAGVGRLPDEECHCPKAGPCHCGRREQRDTDRHVMRV